MRRTFTHAAVILLFAGCSGAEFTSSGDEHDAQASSDTSPEDGKADVPSDAKPDASPDAPGDAPEDISFDVVEEDASDDASDGKPPFDAPADVPAETGDIECDISGIRVAWTPPDLSVYGAASITGAKGGIGTLSNPSMTDFACGPAKDLETEPDRYACCFSYGKAMPALSGKDLFFDFQLSNGKTACNTTGCPAPFTQFVVKVDGQVVTGINVALEDPNCQVASGVCKWVLHVGL